MRAKRDIALRSMEGEFDDINNDRWDIVVYRSLLYTSYVFPVSGRASQSRGLGCSGEHKTACVLAGRRGSALDSTAAVGGGQESSRLTRPYDELVALLD